MNERVDIIRRLAKKHNSSLKRALEKSRPQDIAEALSYAPRHEQRFIWDLIKDNDDIASEVLSCMEEVSLPDFLPFVEFNQLARLLTLMELDDKADVVRNLPHDVFSKLLDTFDEDERTQIEDVLAYPEDQAGALMHCDVLLINENKTCREAIMMLQSAGNIEMAFYLYIETDNHQLVGVLSLRRLLLNPPSTPLKNIMITDLTTVSPTTPQTEVAKIVRRYDLLAIPVVDDHRHLMGIITVDDIIDIICEMQEQQMMLMAGMNEEHNPNEKNVFRAFQQRMTWLLITLFGGIGMAELIGVFESSLSAEAALASFIPVMLGTGGNVGTQAATIAVRNLATGQIVGWSSMTMLMREVKVGTLLGLFFALILGGYALFRYEPRLGAAIAIATISTVICAALLGMMVPLSLNHLKIDPAVATGPFVTTAIDLIAILIYFSTCTLLLNL